MDETDFKIVWKLKDNSRIIGNKLKKVPMGFFSEFSLGKITTMSTTTLSQIEMQVPMLLVLVLGGLLNTFVFALALFYLHIMVGITAVLCRFSRTGMSYYPDKLPPVYGK